MKKPLESLRELVDVQCSDGNWNYDPYMHGMANGMILALAIMNEKEPKYLDKPDVWGYEKKNVDRFPDPHDTNEHSTRPYRP